jgi:hypothetical protein
VVLRIPRFGGTAMLGMPATRGWNVTQWIVIALLLVIVFQNARVQRDG